MSFVALNVWVGWFTINGWVNFEVSSRFYVLGSCTQGVDFGAAFFQTLALGEILNPAQRIRVEGFEHVMMAGARQVGTALRSLTISGSITGTALLPEKAKSTGVNSRNQTRPEEGAVCSR
jgi:hypothetical protein